MKMSLDNTTDGNVVQRYEPGLVQIRNHSFRRSLVVLPNRLLSDWPPSEAQLLQPNDLQTIIECRPEVLILGTGEHQVFPEPAVFAGLMEAGIGCEVMNNAAACRTFNILLAEDRQVALALMLDGD